MATDEEVYQKRYEIWKKNGGVMGESQSGERTLLKIKKEVRRLSRYHGNDSELDGITEEVYCELYEEYHEEHSGGHVVADSEVVACIVDIMYEQRGKPCNLKRKE